MRIRKASVAGFFYPIQAAELSENLDQMLAEAKVASIPTIAKAAISPHAGYVYSGPVAATLFASLRGRAPVSRVVMLGPSHRVAFRGLALSSNEFFETPLGCVEVDLPWQAKLAGLPQVQILDEAHAQEHSLEVQIPFIQKIWPKAKIIPIVVGSANPEEVSEVLEQVWGGEDTFVLISSDLSHYLPYAEAQKIDRVTSRLITALDGEGLDHHQACGFFPVRGLLDQCRKRELPGKVIDLRNSGDTAGDRSRVVGYGAYVFGRE